MTLASTVRITQHNYYGQTRYGYEVSIGGRLRRYGRRDCDTIAEAVHEAGLALEEFREHDALREYARRHPRPRQIIVRVDGEFGPRGVPDRIYALINKGNDEPPSYTRWMRDMDEENMRL